MGKIGVQLYSVWPYCEKNYVGTVERLTELGYDGIQFFANFYHTEAKDITQTIAEKGVTPAGSHVSLPDLTGDALQKTFEFHHTLGNDLLICPALPKEWRETADDYRRAAEQFNHIGQQCKDQGFRFGYHNHDFEFEQMDGETGFDLIFQNTDPALVKVEIDCYWAAYAGVDPLSLLSIYKERCISLHIKDMKSVAGKKVNTEIGTGELNIKQIVEEGKKYGVQWFTVEQEEFDIDPFESLQISAKHLREIVHPVNA
ncbi:sugar phosphate isomerase/epimerase [Bacillaceae bacterium SIJ1]|uniref:sugar phosphate isomerase/epimerase family protein n=1 Tax=Litoribacterium kuwaitense TaxID=1398745 RepID=UPI0013EC8B4B|nr:sugar phosphate isomerase/epimerase [Litoribacterium kuwaitense]NGP46539.1 sugar phosphate isomerase/epimerase [Litoribacterium kuwaitense]